MIRAFGAHCQLRTLAGSGYVTFAFQKIGAPNLRTPWTFLRKAVGWTMLHVTDIPFLNAAAIVTRQRLESIGFKVILKAMDWSTQLAARTSKELPEKGGWNLFLTWLQGAEVIDPAVHMGLSGAGPRALFGWPDVPELEKLVTDWLRATDQIKRKELANELQKVALREVTYVPWGDTTIGRPS
jgi:peptide/nickel transport system substrate-binding protein